jgi:HSP20 family protein
MGELLLLQQRMNRLFEESLNTEPGSGPGGGWIPIADLWETADCFVLEVELPGVEPEDVEVELGDGEVSIRGHRSDPRTPGAPERFRCLERSHGPFARRFALTAGVDGPGARRSHEEGVLKLEIPKRKRTRRA